jgi:hypothetical protein
VDFWDLTKVIIRRWYVALPLILISVASSLWVYSTVEPDYKATAYVSLIPPQSPADPEEIVNNPYLDLGLLALNQSAVTVLREREFLEELVAQGLSDSIAISESYPAPIVTIEVIGGTKEQALATADAVVTRYSDAVLALQTDANATENSIIVPKRLDRGGNFEEMGGPVKRAFIAVLGAGLMVTAGLTVGLDALLRRRSRRSGTGADVRQPAPSPMLSTATPAPPSPVPSPAPSPLVSPMQPPSARTETVVPPELPADRDAESGDSTIVLPLAFRTGPGRGGRRG